MDYVLIALIGLVAGAATVFIILLEKQRWVEARSKSQAAEAQKALDAARAHEGRLAAMENDLTQRGAQVEQGEGQLKGRVAEFESRRAAFEDRFVSYENLQNENAILKRDLQNVDVNLNKLQLDGELHRQRQEQLDQRSTALAERYLGETVKAVVASVGPNNFAACKQRLLNVIGWCREVGFEVASGEEVKLLADLKSEFEREVRRAFEREEQERIKARIREEERLQREIDREVKQLERERAAIQAALDQALAEAKDKHSEEIQRLQARLTEAEEKSKRAISMAQQTKAGNVYVISNIGSFGEGVFKIGMTRRLKPEDRVRELSSASVPFPYDVHAMISCDDAPSLENALHRAFHKQRMNKANPRKEFFKVEIETILAVVREHRGEVQYVIDPEASQYRQSLTMSDEDAEFIESVYDRVDDETAVPDDQ